jgi:hypothetical protein
MSLLSVLLIIWAAVTVAFAVVTIWKSLIAPKAEDVVTLDPAEAPQAAEQQQMVVRVERLTSWAKRFGISSLALLLVTGGVWVYQVISTFNTPRVP